MTIEARESDSFLSCTVVIVNVSYWKNKYAQALEYNLRYIFLKNYVIPFSGSLEHSGK